MREVRKKPGEGKDEKQGCDWCCCLNCSFGDNDHERDSRFNHPFMELIFWRRNLTELGHSQRCAIHVTQETVQSETVLQIKTYAHLITENDMKFQQYSRSDVCKQRGDHKTLFGTIFVYTYCFGTLVNHTLFNTQKCLSLNDKFCGSSSQIATMSPLKGGMGFKVPTQKGNGNFCSEEYGEATGSPKGKGRKWQLWEERDKMKQLSSVGKMKKI